ncbi:MAG: GTP cyclohydrolase II [Candidatus Diapherotrites archaeon]|nr:GTP cyclohydrolase II [Candidatus Diapherotrites archaeon]
MFGTVADSIGAIARGEIVILVDSHERENEGDFVVAASKITATQVNFMLRYGRGVLCVPVSEQKARALGFQRMTENSDRFQTPFTVSVDAKTVSTGVSVEDRLKTIKLISSGKSKPSDFVKPGHVFPLVSKNFGVLERQGHTEGAVDLVELAGMPGAAVIVEIMNEDGSMARLADLEKVAKKFGFKMLSIQELLDFRLAKEELLEKIASPRLPTEFGEFLVFGFQDKVLGKEYVAVTKGSVRGKRDVLCRIHSACFTGDILFSKKCDCHEQLVESLKLISKNGGVLVYALEHEGRGIGLINKLRAYELQDRGLDTVEANEKLGFKADNRNYAMQAQVIRALKIKSVRLLSNNPDKARALEKYGVVVSSTVPLRIKPNVHNKNYLETKKRKFAHLL